MRRRLLWLVLALVTLTPLTATTGANASPDDPISAADIVQSGWSLKDWDHFGNPLKGTVEAESWVDLHWPCFDATDEDQDCMIEDARGHGTVSRQYKVKRVMVDRVRIRVYPSGTILAQNDADTPISQRTLPLVEGTTAWKPTEQFCGPTDWRLWSRITFWVRWSDDWLTKDLSLLSDPTENLAQSICETNATALAERKAVHDQLMAAGAARGR
jgi:hypothetical protein